MESLTLSELANLTGLKPRTLQFWTSSGVIVPEAGTKNGGPGVHRRYPHHEVLIACILADISRFNLQVGALISIGSFIRECFDYANWFDAALKLLVRKMPLDEGDGAIINERPYANTEYKYPEPVLGYDKEIRPNTLINAVSEKMRDAILEGAKGNVDAWLLISYEDGKLIINPTVDGDFNFRIDERPSSYLVVMLGRILPKAVT